MRLDFARFLAQQGEPLQALQILRQFISDKPDEQAAWLLGGEIALSQPEFLEFARDWTGEAIKYFPGAQPILAQRAEALLLSADVEHSLPLWRRAATPSRPRHRAALFLCEMLSDGECPIPAELEPAVSQEFLEWYRALLTHGAADLIGAIHARLDRLRAALPLASRVVEQALGEADRESTAENCRSQAL